MIPMISYFLPLLPWTKKSLDHLARSLKYTMEETNKPWYELGIMEQYLYPKTVRECRFTKFRRSYGCSKIQSNGKARLGNYGRWYLRVTQENDGLSDNQE